MTSDVRRQYNHTVAHAIGVAVQTALAVSSAFLTASTWLGEKSEMFEARAELDDVDAIQEITDGLD